MGKEYFEPGKSVSFRLPVDTPQEMIDALNDFKKREGKNFHKTLISLLFDAVVHQQQEDALSIPLQKRLTDEERNWIKNPMTQRFLSGLFQQVIQRPEQAFNVLTSTSARPSVDLETSNEEVGTSPRKKGFSLQGAKNQNIAKALLNQN